MVDREVAAQGLAALSVAIGELIEDPQVEAVSTLPASHLGQIKLFEQLKQTGRDVVTLAEAAEVLIRRRGE